MKRIQLSLITLIASSSLAMAGGDIAPIEFYEEVENVEAMPVEPAPVYEASPVYESAPVVESVPVYEPAPVVESVPVYEPAPVVESVPVYEPTPVVEVAPVVEATPVVKPPVVVAPIPVVAAVAGVSGFYAGLGLVAARYDTNCNCDGEKNGVDKTEGVMARVGYDFNKYIGLEGRGMLSKYNSNGGEIKHAGLFVKPMLPVGDATNLYGLIGAAKTTTQGSLRHTDVTGLAFGAGIEYDLSDDKKKDAKYDREFDGKGDQEKGLGLFADYERLYYKSGSPDLDTISAGVTYDF